VETFSTPRRLALTAHGLPLATEGGSEERRGPRADAPAQAVEGFLRSTGLAREQLEEREDGKGRFLYAVIDKPGRATAAVLAEAIPAIVRDFPWPKSMRWGAGTSRWVRPLQGIVALLYGELVECEAAGVTAGYATAGHRFLHHGPITIGGADDYAVKLRAGHVIVDQAERARIIRDGAAALADAAGLAVVPDQGLVEENAGLTEWPVPLLGRFDPAFLAVPREVIQLTMRVNQKYFALSDASSGDLAPNFMCVANLTASDGGAAIVAGNERVLSARLSDAKFFWEQDLRAPLEAFLPKLESMLFYEGMGSLRAKADRIAALSGHIARKYFPDCEPATAERAALLAKADLATAMVGEFPELQGVMGGYYAEAAGEKPGVVRAIAQQYQPVVEGSIPICVALADRLDTLVSFFSRGIKPTGSKDPFALRRAALYAIQTIVDSGTRLGLRDVLEAAGTRAAEGRLDVDELLDFLADRLKVQQREAGVRHDLIDAVFALGGEDDLVRLLARVRALQSFVATEDGANLLAGYKRAANILRIEEKKGGLDAGGGGFTPEPAEQALIAALDAAGPRAETAVVAEDFEGAMAALAILRTPIDRFFDDVTVNDADPVKRASRLALLARIRDAVHRVADFSRIEG
jgi:glycyl-tRNA synthetase beta chain